MKRILRNVALLTVVVLTAACPRRVEVESEPNEPRYLQAASGATAELDVVGTHEVIGSDVRREDADFGDRPSLRATRRP